ncbi:thioredoxin domain-containing protein [Kangiella aquimarina]|uniref:Thioredoxin domain-containing protein n=1 Tax=Kangiella aquimarina TaxID=261965 RepID=A0ABZ0X5X6_9GAMM|nr:thioredoxin domain-containing protein [Kangiella aquimarina]WQG85769.1 thioredoxin domain-containing protein [Kangiella aquimarina]
MTQQANLKNDLKGASSPYLQQHQDNPVHWQQWSADTLELARQLDKPILLSVGYSSCHWCHVMAHESFEDEATAEVMNDLFINIKLDREERPDLDKTYQLAHQLLNRQAGGWPLTTFLDPQTLTPFFSGTYFPNRPKYGMPAFTDLLKNIAGVFTEKRQEIKQQNGQLQEALQFVSGSVSRAEPSNQVTANELSNGFINEVLQRADKDFGGFKGAPKFPQAAIWQTVFELSADRDNQLEELSDHLQNTLNAFADYGLYDHLGGGFFRYCVDEGWDIPHFEKMLYDNGQLIKLMAEAGHYYARGDWMQCVKQSVSWLSEQMQSEQATYYSALDADSLNADGHSEEGAYYAWSQADLQSLNDEERAVANQYYGLADKPNFEGQWHLVCRHSLQEVAEKTGIHPKQLPLLIEEVRQQLKHKRDQRPLPFLDDKQLTSWNGLLLQGLFSAARQLGDQDILQQAISAQQGLQQTVWRDGQLMACYRDGTAYQPGFLDDYAYLAKALLMRLTFDFDKASWQWLLQLCEALWEKFADQKNGGFYYTASDAETVITRHKSWSDDAMPNSACQALEVLWLVSELTGKLDWQDFIEKSLHSAGHEAIKAPLQYPSVVRLARAFEQGSEIWVLRGDLHQTVAWQEYLTTGQYSERWVFSVRPDEDLLEQKYPAQEMPVAYCCRNRQCFPALASIAAIKEFLN